MTFITYDKLGQPERHSEYPDEVVDELTSERDTDDAGRPTSERDKQIHAMAQSGPVTQSEIAERFGLSQQRVGQILRASGSHRAERELPSERDIWLMVRLREQGHSVREIAEAVYWSKSTVHRVLRDQL